MTPVRRMPPVMTMAPFQMLADTFEDYENVFETSQDFFVPDIALVN